MALPSLPTFVESRHRGGFIVSEAEGFRSRDVATMTNSTGAQIIYPPGLVLEIATAQNGTTPPAVQPYTASITAGTKGAILYESTIVAAGATVKVTIVSRDAELNASELSYDASITTPALQAPILSALALTGLIAR